MKKISLLSILFVLIATGCLNNESIPMQSWNTIEPGKTTESQVISLLGEPDAAGEWHGEYYYEYFTVGLNQYHSNRIYFRNRLFREKIVSWLDVELGVDQNNPYTISGAMSSYGSIVDSAATRRFIDVVQPEIMYIWADQGVAVLALSSEQLQYTLPQTTIEKCGLLSPIQQKFTKKAFSFLKDHSDPCDIAVRLVLFKPMSFEDFWDNYSYKILQIDYPLVDYIH